VVGPGTVLEAIRAGVSEVPGLRSGGRAGMGKVMVPLSLTPTPLELEVVFSRRAGPGRTLLPPPGQLVGCGMFLGLPDGAWSMTGLLPGQFPTFRFLNFWEEKRNKAPFHPASVLSRAFLFKENSSLSDMTWLLIFCLFSPTTFHGLSP
jgi:hypothetical protein